MTTPWEATRRLLALAALATWLPRGRFVPEVYSDAGVVVGIGELPLARWFTLPEPVAWATWGALIAALCVLLWRPSRLAALVGFATAGVLVYLEALNEKAYDRLLLLQLLGLAVAGSGEGGAGAWARSWQRLLFCGIYGSTGLAKLGWEPAWADGSALASHLVDASFGLRPVGLLVAQAPPLVAVLGWGTVAFEVGFMALIWWGRARPWLLAVGAAFHVGILVTMNVGTFSWVALAGYPAMLTASEWDSALARLASLRRPLVGAAVAYLLASIAPAAARVTFGPWPGVAWVPPDVNLHRTTEAALGEVLRDGASAAAAARGGPRWTLGREGPVVHLWSRPQGDSPDGSTGVAVILVLAEVWRPRGVRVELAVGEPPSGPSDQTVFLGPLGHVAGVGGSQVWPWPWDWLLTNRGDFVAVGGSRAFARAWAKASPVDVMALPMSLSPPDLGEGTVALTDTARLRAPAPEHDTPGHLSVDQLTRVAQALMAVLDPPPSD